MGLETQNQRVGKEWLKLENIVAISNNSNYIIEIWIGNIAPTKDSLGHHLHYGDGFNNSLFENGVIYVKSRGENSAITITKKGA